MLNSLPLNTLYYGRPADLPDRSPLRAGPVSLTFENGAIRYVRLGDQEILRMVYVAVRDCNWGTVAPKLRDLRIESTGDTFHVSFDSENRQEEIDFIWRGAITGHSDGKVLFTMEGEARSTFRCNRAGFCVLHPIRECAGRACTVEHVDGSLTNGVFPQFISPHQPFYEMRAISHEVAPGIVAEVRMEGETFEMEDQRNWTDASFKTYCPPLRIPFPVTIERGTRISQSVTLRVKGETPDLQNRSEEGYVRLALGERPIGRLPQVGLGAASHGRPLTDTELERLRRINLSHLRVDLRLSLPAWEAHLLRAVKEASDLKLDVALILSHEAEAELAALGEAVRRIKPAVRAWLIFHQSEKVTSARWIELARERLQSYDTSAQFGSGSNAYFVELNREHPPVELLDFVCFSINPQVHAWDNDSLVETLEAQAATIESARRFIGDKPLHIGPVTLKPRFNPDATGPEVARPGTLPPQVDARQMSLFGAGWTIGALKMLAESGVESVTFYETTGWRGVMEVGSGSTFPEIFASIPGAVFPLYHSLADAGEFAGGEVLPVESSDQLRANALAIRRDDSLCLLLANHRCEPVALRIQNINGIAVVRRLDETSVWAAMTDPNTFRSGIDERMAASGELSLTLKPYATARVVIQSEER
jgi:D-apionolactonase